jgi:hypothetical protein
MAEVMLDRAGRRRSPAATAGFHAGRTPCNKGLRYPADPPQVEEIIAVMRAAGEGPHGQRLRGLIVILWRAGLRIQEALSLAELDLDPRRGSLLVCHGKGGRRREVGMDSWAWHQLQPWLETRVELPVGPLFCIVTGDRRAAGTGRPPEPEQSCGTPPREPACGDASHRTNSVTPTPLRWPTKASRWSSSNANSATATSASPRSTSKASTTPRSSTPSTPVPPRWSR